MTDSVCTSITFIVYCLLRNKNTQKSNISINNKLNNFLKRDRTNLLSTVCSQENSQRDYDFKYSIHGIVTRRGIPLSNAVVTTGRTCNVHLSTADFVEKFYVARTFFSDTHGAGRARRRFLQYLSYSHIKTVGIAELAYGRRSLRSVVTTALE